MLVTEGALPNTVPRPPRTEQRPGLSRYQCFRRTAGKGLREVPVASVCMPGTAPTCPRILSQLQQPTAVGRYAVDVKTAFRKGTCEELASTACEPAPEVNFERKPDTVAVLRQLLECNGLGLARDALSQVWL